MYCHFITYEKQGTEVQDCRSKNIKEIHFYVKLLLFWRLPRDRCFKHCKVSVGGLPIPLLLEFTGSCCLEQMKFSQFGDSYSVHEGIESHIWDTKVTAYCAARKMQNTQNAFGFSHVAWPMHQLSSEGQLRCMAVKSANERTLRCPSGTLTRGELFLYELGCIPSSLISLRQTWDSRTSHRRSVDCWWNETEFFFRTVNYFKKTQKAHRLGRENLTWKVTSLTL